MARRSLSAYKPKGPPKVQAQVLEYTRASFVYSITVRADGSFKVMLGTREIAKGAPLVDKGAAVTTNALMIDAERLAHEAIERNPMG